MFSYGGKHICNSLIHHLSRCLAILLLQKPHQLSALRFAQPRKSGPVPEALIRDAAMHQ